MAMTFILFVLLGGIAGAVVSNSGLGGILSGAVLGALLARLGQLQQRITALESRDEQGLRPHARTATSGPAGGRHPGGVSSPSPVAANTATASAAESATQIAEESAAPTVTTSDVASITEAMPPLAASAERAQPTRTARRTAPTGGEELPLSGAPLRRDRMADGTPGAFEASFRGSW